MNGDQVSDENQDRMAEARVYADVFGRMLKEELPEGCGFFLMIEPEAVGVGTVASNMTPEHIVAVMEKIIERLPSAERKELRGTD